MESVLTIISSVLGCSTLVGFILYGKANRRIKNSEAGEAEDHRFDTLLQLIDSLTSRLSKLNDTVDKHIDRNRELSDRAYKSEREINNLNERLLAVTEERDGERRLKEHYKLWHCRRGSCSDRVPPNDKLGNLKYEPPNGK